jgi:hypothetical protein
MEHLDHLLGTEASRQFHGGDYLSAESSSSVSSVESSKPRLAPKSTRTTPPNHRTVNKCDKPGNNKRNENNEDDDDSVQQSTKIGTGGRNSTTDEIDDIAGVEGQQQQQRQQQKSSPLWSLEPRIFATEKGSGKRKYIVGEFGRIVDWYWRKTAPSSRHLYELIREGSPCRLYFDLEYSRAHNPSVPEVKLLRELEEELAIELHLHYGKLLPRLRSSQIVNLNSSNKKKFSRHWIVHLLDGDDSIDDVGQPTNMMNPKERQEYLFKDAPTVGRFIKRMVGRLADDMAAEGEAFAKKRPALAKHLFVNTKDTTKQVCVIDLGVYTRNRLFRCVGSSKKGKVTTLQPVFRETETDDDNNETDQKLPAENNDYNNGNDDAQNNDTGGDRCYFPLSIPQKKEIESSQASSSNVSSIDTFITGNDWEPHAQALADSLVVPLKNEHLPSNSSSNSTRILEVEEGSHGSTGSIVKDKTTQNRYPPATSMARQASPLPSLDRYVTENLATRGGGRGSIRAWSIEYGHRNDTPVSFTYHLQKNRFCEMVGRSHKSNNVFWTIDLNSWTCIQGCHDPDCFGRGSPLPISNSNAVVVGGGKHQGGGRRIPSLDSIQQEFESWQEEEFEKALSELNLDDIVAGRPAAADDDSSSSASQSGPGRNCGRDEYDEKTDDDDSEYDLSDEALLQAIGDNPELFP